MNKEDIQDAIIPLLSTFMGTQLYEANQDTNVPEGPHAIFNFTSPYIKDVGMESRGIIAHDNNLEITHSEDFKFTMSLTVVVPVEGADHNKAKSLSLQMAQTMRDWFAFYGEEAIMMFGIAVTNLTDVTDRNSINEDEYRNGFDITGRAHRVLSKTIDYFDKTEIQGG